MKPIYPPGKRKPEKRGPAAGPEKQPAPEQEQKERSPAVGAGDDSGSSGPSREELNAAWSDPVTNQDEQDKITNTGGDDLPIADN